MLVRRKIVQFQTVSFESRPEIVALDDCGRLWTTAIGTDEWQEIFGPIQGSIKPTPEPTLREEQG